MSSPIGNALGKKLRAQGEGLGWPRNIAGRVAERARRHGITDLWQFSCISTGDLNEWRNLGQISIRHIRAAFPEAAHEKRIGKSH